MGWGDLAQQVYHSFDGQPAMPDAVKEAAFRITVGGATAVAERLASQIGAWRCKAADL